MFVLLFSNANRIKENGHVLMVNNRLQEVIECILRENEPLAGYQIFEALTASKGSIASFYTTLFGMERSGIIEAEWRFVAERHRKYYRLAKNGNPVPKEGFSLASILKIDQKFWGYGTHE